MKHVSEYTKPRPQENQEYGERETAIVKKLFESMKANYGGLFLSALDDQKTQAMWERSWMASIAGKSHELVAKALTHCLDTHSKPFARADFQQAYRALTPKAMHQRNKDALALPSSTYEDRRKDAQKHIAEARKALGG